MALKPKLPLADKTFTAFKRGVDASQKHTRALTKLWDTNVEKTFGDIPKDWQDDAVRVNKEFSRVKQKQSLLFFRVPEVQLKPLRPDAEQVAGVAAAALNQVLSREMSVSYMVDEVLTDALCPAGIGVSKISYEAITQKQTVPLPEFRGVDQAVLAGLQETGVETTTEIDVPTYECYDWRRVPYKDFLYPTDFDGSNWDEAPWLGLAFTMPAVEAKRTYKLSQDDVESAKCGPSDRLDGDADKDDIVGKVRGYEIWYRACFFDSKVSHKDHFRKLVYFHGVEKPVVHEDSPYQWYENGQLLGVKRYPIRVLSLTYVPDRPIPPSDVTITRPQVAELEMSRTLMMKQRERSLPIRWFDTNQVDELTEGLLQEGVIQGWLPMNGPATNAIGEIARANYPRENFEFDRVINQEISEAWAIGSEQMGQNAPGEATAREVAERSTAAQTRLDYERSKVLRFFKEGAEVVFGLLQKFATQPKYAELVGESGAATLVRWSAQTLRGDYAFEAKPDAALRLDAQSDRSQALNVYQLLRRDELVDAKGLLTEVVRTHNMLPEKVLVQQPPQPAPEKPSISFRFSGEDMDPTRPSAQMVYSILEQSGMKIPPEVIEAAKAQATRTLALAAQNPAMALADSMRLDVRADAGATPGTGAQPQPQHGGVQPQAEPINKTQMTESRVK